MRTVTLDVRPPAAAMADFARAWKTGRPRKSAHISFATPELLWRVLTQKRWELLKVPHAARGAMSRRSTAMSPRCSMRESSIARRMAESFSPSTR